jgi:hypothetical protein
VGSNIQSKEGTEIEGSFRLISGAAFLITEKNFWKIQDYRDLWKSKAALKPTAEENQATSIEQVTIGCIALPPTSIGTVDILQMQGRSSATTTKSMGKR